MRYVFVSKSFIVSQFGGRWPFAIIPTIGNLFITFGLREYTHPPIVFSFRGYKSKYKYPIMLLFCFMLNMNKSLWYNFIFGSGVIVIEYNSSSKLNKMLNTSLSGKYFLNSSLSTLNSFFFSFSK